MSLRTIAESDAKSIFINTNELAQEITLNEYTINAIILDNQSQIVINQFENSGLLSDITRLFVADSDWPEGLNRPVPGAVLVVNTRKLLIDKCNLSYGLWKIDLGRQEQRAD